MIFDGLKVDVHKPLSPEFQVSHKFQLGSVAASSTYQFGAVFADSAVRPTAFAQSRC